MLRDAAKRGKGTLKWYPNTVIKDLEYNAAGNQITSAVAIQHQPQPDTPPINADFLSQIIEDAYTYADSARFHKNIVRFVPPATESTIAPPWYVVEATETGELIGLADLPHRLGVDPRSDKEPSASSTTGNPYCTQGTEYAARGIAEY